MAQRVLFPMQYLRVTQKEYGNTSHKGCLATDYGGEGPGGNDPVYAPCDMKCIRVRPNSSHEMFFESTSDVECADGYVGKVHFTFMHDDDINPNVFEGNIILQGEPFMEEGTFGGGVPNAFPSHLHLEVGKGPSPGRQIQNSALTWYTSPESHHYDIMFVAADTIVLDGGGYPWKTTTDKLLNTSGNQPGGGGGGGGGGKPPGGGGKPPDEPKPPDYEAELAAALKEEQNLKNQVAAKESEKAQAQAACTTAEQHKTTQTSRLRDAEAALKTTDSLLSRRVDRIMKGFKDVSQDAWSRLVDSKTNL